MHSYSALVNAGLFIGAVLVFLGARHREIDVRPTADVALAAALGGLVLARAAYVGVHWAYYAEHPRHALQVWEGGLLWQGALVGAIMGIAAMCAARDLPLLAFLDILTPGAASLAVFAWLACHMTGCAWGVATYPGQGPLWTLSLNLPNLYGLREPRVAVQLLGAGWSVILLGTVLVLQRRTQRDGVVFTLWLTLHSLGSLGLGFLRADETVSVAGWRIDQWANLALSIMGAAMLLMQVIGRPRVRVERQE